MLYDQGYFSEVPRRSQTRLLWVSEPEGEEIGVIYLYVVLCCGILALCVSFDGFVCELEDKGIGVGERSYNGFVPVLGARHRAVGLCVRVTALVGRGSSPRQLAQKPWKF